MFDRRLCLISNVIKNGGRGLRNTAAAQQRHAPDRRHAGSHLLSEMQGGG
jgi:hypothetical protein